MILSAIEYGAVRRILYRFRLIFGVSTLIIKDKVKCRILELYLGKKIWSL